MLARVMINDLLHTAGHAQIALLVAAQAERAALRLLVDGTARARPGEWLHATGEQSVEANVGQAHAVTSTV